MVGFATSARFKSAGLPSTVLLSPARPGLVWWTSTVLVVVRDRKNFEQAAVAARCISPTRRGCFADSRSSNCVSDDWNA